ncbi:hypothetical protein [Adlercreutzia sp. ZJ242]|uniref:hypothetical protein n=1 Tax=Adlercreutzia sp. ZJ242 TaxID=2709409 RepID=UPI0013EB8E6E|nr:hypothetical protein [Adlercreutzia sp. ZJ242]
MNSTASLSDTEPEVLRPSIVDDVTDNGAFPSTPQVILDAKRPLSAISWGKWMRKRRCRWFSGLESPITSVFHPTFQNGGWKRGVVGVQDGKKALSLARDDTRRGASLGMTRGRTSWRRGARKIREEGVCSKREEGAGLGAFLALLSFRVRHDLLLVAGVEDSLGLLL